MIARHDYSILRRMIEIMNEVSRGDTTNVETLFELTKEGMYPLEIVNLAEAFGMMVVNIDAKQQHLELVLEDLKQKNTALKQVSGNLLNANVGMLEVLGNAIAKRDSTTSDHNYRVTIHSIHLGKAMGLAEKELCSLIKGAFLHDIGKIAISDAILLKPAKLTSLEFDQIKTHVTHGCDIIKAYPWLSDATDVVLHHHEKYNGTGYPDRLAGKQIPVNARIFAIVDVFDALTSTRPYKDSYPFDMVMKIMADDAGSHFDPDIFELFRQDAVRHHDVIAGYTEAQLVAVLQTLMHDYFETASEHV